MYICVCLSSYASHISSEIFNCDSIFYICIHPSIRCARLYWLTNLPHCKKKPLTHMCDWRTYTNVQLHIYTYMSYIHRQTHIPSNPFHQIYIQNSEEYEWTYDNICPIFMGDENMLKYHTMHHCTGINSKYTFFLSRVITETSSYTHVLSLYHKVCALFSFPLFLVLFGARSVFAL